MNKNRQRPEPEVLAPAVPQILAPAAPPFSSAPGAHTAQPGHFVEAVQPAPPVQAVQTGQPVSAPESAGAAYVCSRCSLCGPGCCRMPLAHSEGRFPLSDADCTRLQAYPVFDGKSGIEEAPNTAELQKNLQTLLPAAKRKILEQFPLGGRHKRLALRPLPPAKGGFQDAAYGQCAFLGPLGCTVKIEDRPLYCRLFPFWASENTLNCFMPEDCLAVKEAATLGQLLRLLQVTEKDVLKLFDALQKEWKLKD